MINSHSGIILIFFSTCVVGALVAATTLDKIKLYLVIGMCVTSVLFFLIGNLIEVRINKRLKIFPRRRMFVNLERLRFVNRKPFFIPLRIIVLVLYILIVSAMYIFLKLLEKLRNYASNKV